MKKSSGFKKIFLIVFLIIAFGGLGSAYIALKKKCNDLRKQITEASDNLRYQDNRTLDLFAVYQRLTSEDRIMSLAEKELGMVIADRPILVLTIEQDKINQLNSLLNYSNE